MIKKDHLTKGLSVYGEELIKIFDYFENIKDLRIDRKSYIGDKTTKEVSYYISSLPSKAIDIAAAVRLHWSIENTLHWTLDVSFSEDQCPIRKGNTPNNRCC